MPGFLLLWATIKAVSPFLSFAYISAPCARYASTRGNLQILSGLHKSSVNVFALCGLHKFFVNVFALCGERKAKKKEAKQK